MSKKVDVKNFELQKVKFNAKKGLIINFFDINSPNDLWNVDSDSQPSEDYLNAINALKEVFAYSLQLNNGWEFARENNRKNDDALKKSIQFWNEEVERCNVTGLSVVGVGDSKGIKISGSLKTDLGVVGLTSPIIRFDSFVTNSIDEDVMIGDLAETAFVKIQLEIWSFIFAGKRGGELYFPESEKPVSGLNITKLEKVG
jgi:hypothetical protein